MAAFLNYDNKRFSTVTCDSCGFTEFYAKQVSAAGKIADLMG